MRALELKSGDYSKLTLRSMTARVASCLQDAREREHLHSKLQIQPPARHE